MVIMEFLTDISKPCAQILLLIRVLTVLAIFVTVIAILIRSLYLFCKRAIRLWHINDTLLIQQLDQLCKPENRPIVNYQIINTTTKDEIVCDVKSTLEKMSGAIEKYCIIGNGFQAKNIEMIVFSEGILHLKTIEYSVINLCGNKAKDSLKELEECLRCMIERKPAKDIKSKFNKAKEELEEMLIKG